MRLWGEVPGRQSAPLVERNEDSLHVFPVDANNKKTPAPSSHGNAHGMRQVFHWILLFLMKGHQFMAAKKRKLIALFSVLIHAWQINDFRETARVRDALERWCFKVQTPPSPTDVKGVTDAK